MNIFTKWIINSEPGGGTQATWDVFVTSFPIGGVSTVSQQMLPAWMAGLVTTWTWRIEPCFGTPMQSGPS